MEKEKGPDTEIRDESSDQLSAVVSDTPERTNSLLDEVPSPTCQGEELVSTNSKEICTVNPQGMPDNIDKSDGTETECATNTNQDVTDEILKGDAGDSTEEVKERSSGISEADPMNVDVDCDSTNDTDAQVTKDRESIEKKDPVGGELTFQGTGQISNSGHVEENKELGTCSSKTSEDGTSFLNATSVEDTSDESTTEIRCQSTVRQEDSSTVGSTSMEVDTEATKNYMDDLINIKSVDSVPIEPKEDKNECKEKEDSTNILSSKVDGETPFTGLSSDQIHAKKTIQIRPMESLISTNVSLSLNSSSVSSLADSVTSDVSISVNERTGLDLENDDVTSAQSSITSHSNEQRSECIEDVNQPLENTETNEDEGNMEGEESHKSPSCSSKGSKAASDPSMSEVVLEDASSETPGMELNSETSQKHQEASGSVPDSDKHNFELSESELSARDSIALEGNCATVRDDTIDQHMNQVSSSSNDVNGEKDIEAMARADVDTVCNDDTVCNGDTIENGSQNEEEDPFLSCTDKNKETDGTDYQEREVASPMDVEITYDDHEKGSHPKTPSSVEERETGTISDETVQSVDDTSRSGDDAISSIDGTANTVDKMPSFADGLASLVEEAVGTSDDTSNIPDEVTIDEETITADKASAGDEELCIVPDTEPRVPTDKEKADAVEKAAKVSSTLSKEDLPPVAPEVAETPEAETNDQNVPDFQESALPIDDNSSATSNKDLSISPPTDQEKILPTAKATSTIQVVSTASLQSQSHFEDIEKEKAADKNSSDSSDEQTCCQCSKVTKCKYKIKDKEETFVCEDDCYAEYRNKSGIAGVSLSASSVIRARKLDRSFLHKCGQCKEEVNITVEKSLTWETMDFCNDECLEKYQRTLGSHCANCKGPVQTASLGKYCVRFGYDMRQFCMASCLEDFKKGLKVCSYCQKDISAGLEGFLAPVGDKGQFKDFCSQVCMEKYDQMSNNITPPETTYECAVCYNVKVVRVEVISSDSKVQKLCSEPCFAAFKFVNAIVADQCDMCKKYFDKDNTENFTVFYDDAPHSFCSKTCMNVYILAKRKIVPCTWCKVKKYNFDMIKRVLTSGQVLMMCSLNCMTLFNSHTSSKKSKCDNCKMTSHTQYHLTMSDDSTRNFCSHNCVMSFQARYSKPPIPIPGDDSGPHPLGNPRKIVARRSVPVGEKEVSKTIAMPVISSVKSLAPTNGKPTPRSSQHLLGAPKHAVEESVKTVYKRQVIIKPPSPPERQNRGAQVKPIMCTKGVSCRPHTCTKETQTDESVGTPTLIPVPVPIYIPAPMHMYSSPYPVPIPFPLPIPVPIFIPTTRNSSKGIFKEIKRIQEKIPSDPFEAEMLMMAEMVAGEKKADHTDTESEEETNLGENDSAHDMNFSARDESIIADHADNADESDFSPEAVDTTSNTFGEEVLQMALKQLEEPAVDFEAAVTPSTIAQSAPQNEHHVEPNNEVTESEVDDSESEARTGLKRTLRSSSETRVPQKRGRKSSGSDHSNVGSSMASFTPDSTPSKTEQAEKPDANMCLKFTFGVNAWKHWVTQKNAELEKAAGNNRKLKLFKTEILQLTADELNYALCLFVKEVIKVRKPNNTDYAPDTIYYLCLGIQQYLIENGRVENIFCDPYYEKFTECLDEVARKFTVLYNDSQFIVTRVEEEHLWESKQLGAHSPYVLLSTLMFFNTKHFNLMTVDEHNQLSFSHIMKHWKRQPSATSNAKAPGPRNILLRFYPPQAALAANSKKKKVYEQQENEDNPLRCPVKLYEFYLSKCPESVKTRNDVFYLLPERSCVPDSPVWYSTMALGRDQLQKMLHRIKMVKEINLAFVSG